MKPGDFWQVQAAYMNLLPVPSWNMGGAAFAVKGETVMVVKAYLTINNVELVEVAWKNQLRGTSAEHLQRCAVLVTAGKDT